VHRPGVVFFFARFYRFEIETEWLRSKALDFRADEGDERGIFVFDGLADLC